MTFFTAYIDDSGTSPSQHVAHATALVIPARQIVALENEWDRIKKKEGFSCFHTSEFVARNPKSDFAKWDDAKQVRVFSRVRQIIKKYGVKVTSFGVYKKDYDEIIPADLREYVGKDHYTWAIRHLLTMLAAWRISRGIEHPLEYVFDWMEKSDSRRMEMEIVLEQAANAAKDAGYDAEYANYSFRHRQNIPGLQCVDPVGWTCYQRGLSAFRNKPLHPFAKTAWQDFNRHNRTGVAGHLEWLTACTVSRENLKEWIADERTALGEIFKKKAQNEKKIRVPHL